MRKDVSKKFIKDIDDSAKLYEVVNAGEVKMYTIELKEDDKYIEIFSCVAVDGEPEAMVEFYLELASTGRFANL